MLGDCLGNIFVFEFDRGKVLGVELQNVIEVRDVLINADFISHFDKTRPV